MPPFTVLEGARKQLGGFSVSRLLPQPACRSLGPFVFFDELGPADFGEGEGIDVRPIPISGWPPSPGSSKARSRTETASAR